MGFDDGIARSHDLQKMGVGRHIGIGVMPRQQICGFARSRLRGCDCHFEFWHPICNRAPPCQHHRGGHFACVAGKLQLFRRFDHAHGAEQSRCIA